MYIEISGRFVKDQKADVISIFYDIGGIVGECNWPCRVYTCNGMLKVELRHKNNNIVIVDPPNIVSNINYIILWD